MTPVVSSGIAMIHNVGSVGKSFLERGSSAPQLIAFLNSSIKLAKELDWKLPEWMEQIKGDLLPALRILSIPKAIGTGCEILSGGKGLSEVAGAASDIFSAIEVFTPTVSWGSFSVPLELCSKGVSVIDSGRGVLGDFTSFVQGVAIGSSFGINPKQRVYDFMNTAAKVIKTALAVFAIIKLTTEIMVISSLSVAVLSVAAGALGISAGILKAHSKAISGTYPIS